MDNLIYAVPAGLLLDIGGIVWLVMYGDAFSKPVDRVATLAVGPVVEVGLSSERKKRRAYVGLAVVVLGFLLQIVGVIPSLPHLKPLLSAVLQ